jgi:hypothetical protein
VTVTPKLKRATADHPLGEQETIHGGSVSDHLGNGTSGHPTLGGVILGGHSFEGSLVSWTDCDLSGHCRAIKPLQVVVLWSLLTFACKTVCYSQRWPWLTTSLTLCTKTRATFERPPLSV